LGAMASSNIFGQASLMCRRGDALEKVFTILSTTYSNRATEMSAEKAKLLQRVIKICKIRAALDPKNIIDRSRSTEVKNLRREMAEGGQAPIVR
jgi:hypothetical protein